MISDILSDAAREIQRYERSHRGYQGDETLTAAIDKLKKVMDAMRQALDCPNEHVAHGMFTIIAELDVSEIDFYLGLQETVARRMQNTGEDRQTAAGRVADYLRQRADELRSNKR